MARRQRPDGRLRDRGTGAENGAEGLSPATLAREPAVVEPLEGIWASAHSDGESGSGEQGMCGTVFRPRAVPGWMKRAMPCQSEETEWMGC